MSNEKRERLEFQIENARIGFRNFAGAEGKFNAAGNRNFSIFLPDEVARQLESAGWSIKWLNSREDEPPQAIINVKVAFNNYPPNVLMVSDGKQTRLTESTVSLLDYAELDRVDLIVRGYPWNVSGRQGIKAYLKTGAFVLHVDPLMRKYSESDDSLEIDTEDQVF